MLNAPEDKLIFEAYMSNKKDLKEMLICSLNNIETIASEAEIMLQENAIQLTPQNLDAVLKRVDDLAVYLHQIFANDTRGTDVPKGFKI